MRRNEKQEIEVRSHNWLVDRIERVVRHTYGRPRCLYHGSLYVVHKSQKSCWIEITDEPDYRRLRY